MSWRCRSYKRGWMYAGIRCELPAGHDGPHYAAGSFLHLNRGHYWGRTRKLAEETE